MDRETPRATRLPDLDDETVWVPMRRTIVRDGRGRRRTVLRRLDNTSGKRVEAAQTRKPDQVDRAGTWLIGGFVLLIAISALLPLIATSAPLIVLAVIALIVFRIAAGRSLRR